MPIIYFIMGMYDTIIVVDKLPWPEEAISLGLNTAANDFQTKDLDCVLGEYTIQGGRLFVKKWKETRWVEGDKAAVFFGDRLGYMERIGEYMEELPHHGAINFYDFANDVDGRWDCWVEFKAILNRGIIENIELVEFNKEDNTERKERERKCIEEQERQERLWYNRYFLRTKVVCRVRRKISRFLSKAASGLQTLSYKV